MKNFLSPAGERLLAQLSWSRVLLAFDFDGTLGPIVAQRGAAKMRPRTAALFAQVCELYPCAVISGRGRRDVSARLGEANVKYVVGNHGLEPGADLASVERLMARARPLLEKALAPSGGVDLEDKRYSLAIHYRASREKRLARAAIQAAVAALPMRLRIIPGKLVVNLLPSGAPNKADALLQLRAKANSDTAPYVGDDVTDEDVFELDQPGRLVSVRVGRSSTSAAPWFLPGQRDIDVLLGKLAVLRRPA